MIDGVLSQAEIDALLNMSRSEPAEGKSIPQATISPMEIDALGEIGNIAMGTSATTLSTLLGTRVLITTPRVSVTTRGALRDEYPLPYVAVEVEYTKGLTGMNMFVIQEKDALIIADLMMGGNGKNPQLDFSEMVLSAIAEAMNQMMGSAATSMSTVFQRKIDISPPKVRSFKFEEDQLKSFFPSDEMIVKVAFSMEVGDLLKSELMQLIPVPFAKEMVNVLLNPAEEEAAVAAPALTAVKNVEPPETKTRPAETPPPKTHVQPSPQQPVSVQPAVFQPLKPVTPSVPLENLGIILDVPLQVSVELGRTRKLIRDILELGPGSIVELDKLAGEPVDVLVSGKLIAKGEVVVIDENFGIRITDIVSPVERLTNLQ